tara:strand:+ start:176 stop:559 length:384 start_codon:yes stop_codon:yes gene_type:complete
MSRLCISSTEAQIQYAIQRWALWKQDIQIWRINVIGVPLKKGGYRPSTNPGMADLHLTLWVEGIPISAWLEVKRARAYQNKNQKKFETQIKDHGGFYFVVRSIDDVEDALKIMREETWKKIRDSTPF